jgi:hypothetical protein
MSGPKVVRVVTREEILATCNRLLRQLDSAVASWEKNLQCLGVKDEAATAGVANRRREIEQLLRNEALLGVQKQVPAEIAWLKADEERCRARVIEAKIVEMQRNRQRKQNATALLTALKAKGGSFDALTANRLHQVAAGDVVGTLAESSLSEAFRLMATPSSPRTLTAAQTEIAGRLKTETDVSDFAKWREAHAPASEPRISALEKRLAELTTYLDNAEIKHFSDRLSAIEQTEESADSNLRIDSLVLDMSAAVSKAKGDAALLAESREVLAELAAQTDASNADLVAAATALSQAIADTRMEVLPTLLAAGRAALMTAVAQRSADGRRTAILTGLKQLGYEVREGMSTAWQEKGRLVLRNPNQPDYGVELASPPGVERMQVRAVAFSADRNLAQDFGVETAWCGDFGKLQSLLASQGGAIEIERAMAVGAVPLKAVAGGETYTDSATPLARSR